MSVDLYNKYTIKTAKTKERNVADTIDYVAFLKFL